MRQPRSDERTTYREVLIHQGPVVVDPAGVRGRRSNLPREICAVSRAGPRRRRTEGAVRPPDPGAEVSSLMDRVARRISDKRLLRLIRAYLNAGVMEDGLVSPTEEGVPQGGPLTPPTMLRTTLLGAPFKRGGTDPIHDPYLLLVEFDFFHQRTDDLPSRLP